jgi:hypothetical protein
VRAPCLMRPDCHSEARSRCRRGMRCRLQGRGIYSRSARGWTRQPARCVRRRNALTGPVRGVATGHEEADSRFLGRALGPVVGRGAGRALPRNDRWGWGRGGYSGDAAPYPARAMNGGVDQRISPGRTEGLASTFGKPAPCRPGVGASVARNRLCGFWLHVVRSSEGVAKPPSVIDFLREAPPRNSLVHCTLAPTEGPRWHKPRGWSRGMKPVPPPGRAGPSVARRRLFEIGLHVVRSLRKSSLLCEFGG